MIAAVILILAALWAFGYVHVWGINFPDFNLFVINNQTITFLDLLIFFFVLWAISILPTPFREISGALLILWMLAILGIISLTGIGLPSVFVAAIIIGFTVSLFTREPV